MLINEVCKKCSLTKKAIEYYIEQGLVIPAIQENGYRSREMQYTVMEYVPGYKTLREYTNDEQALIDMINLAITQEDLDLIQEAYVSAYIKKND